MNSDPLANTTGHSVGRALVTGSAREDIVVQALQDCQAAIDAGKDIDRAAMLEKYPDIRDELSACLDGLELMRRPAGTDSGPSVDRSTHSPISPLAPIGDFRIVREIGRGGMGLVYEAEQLSIGRSVALKVLPYAAMLDKRQIARFQNEARAAATLEHPHIVPVYFVGNERGVYYYAMRLIDGKNLAEVMGELRGSDVEGPPLSQIASQLTGVPNCGAAANPNHVSAGSETVRAAAAETTKIATDHGTRVNVYYESIARLGNQAAHALDFAHGHGIIHRDIKPANIMLDEVGDAWITDFGLARIESDGGMTMTGDLVGTLRYMSPEQTLAKRITVDHRSDVYSLGATLYELLTLRPLFDGDDRASLLKQIAFDEPIAPSKIVSTIPRDLETVILKSLQKNPDDRYSTAQEFADDLQRFLSHEPVKARRTPWIQRIRMWTRRHPAFAGSAAIVCAVSLISAAVVGFLIANHERDARTQQELATQEIQKALLDRQAALDTATANLELANEERKRAEANLQIAVRAVEDAYLNSIGEDRLLRIGLRTGFSPPLETIASRSGLALPTTGIRFSQVAQRPSFSRDERKIVEQGLAFFDQIARQNPSSPQLRFQSAKAFSRLALLHSGLDENSQARKAFQEAISRLQGLTEQDPTTTVYFVELARAYYQQGRLSRWWPDAKDTFHEAITAASRAIELSPEDIDALQLRGRSYLCQQDYELAASDLEKLVTLQPDNADACFELSQVFEEAELTDQALVYAQRSVELAPENSKYREALAYIYKYGQNDDEAAVEVFEPLLKAATTPLQEFELRSKISHFLEDHERTVDLTSRWIALGGETVEAYRWRAKAHAGLGKDELAIADLGECLKRASSDEDYRNIARQFQSLRRIDQALVAWKKAEELNPNNYTLYKERGLALLKAGKHAKSLEDLERLVRIAPNTQLNSEQRLDHSLPHDNVGDAESALAAWMTLAQLNPGEHADIGSALLDMVGYTLLDDARMRESVESATRFLSLVPDRKPFAHVYKTLALFHYRLGDYESALQCISTSIELKPTDPSTLTWIHNVYKPEIKDPPKFRDGYKALMAREVEHFSKLIDENPNVGVYWQNRGTAKRLHGEVEESIADYLQALKLRRGRGSRGYCMLQLASAYNGIGQYEKAFSAYYEAVDLEPTRTKKAHWLRSPAKLHQKLGDLQGALADYTRATTLAPKDAGSWFYRAATHAELGQFEKAVESYTRAIELDPHQLGAWQNRGSAYQELGRFREAVDDASKQIELSPRHSAGWHNRAHANASLGLVEEAIADFSKAIELGDQGVVTCRAKVLEQAGRHEDAVNDWQATLAIRKKKQTKVGASFSIDMDVVDAHRGLAFAMHSASQFDGSLQAYQDSLQLCDEMATTSPEDATCWALVGRANYDLAKLKWATGQINESKADYKLAIAAFEKSLELSRNPGYLLNLAEVLVGCLDPTLRDPERSLSLATESITLANGRANRAFEQGQWLVVGIAQYRLGDWRESLETLEESVPAKGLNYIAMCHWELGDQEIALAKYHEAVKAHKKAALNSEYWDNDDESVTSLYRSEAAALLELSDGK